MREKILEIKRDARADVSELFIISVFQAGIEAVYL
jgi:hypothetical protein